MELSKSLKDKLANRVLIAISALSGFLVVIIAIVMLYQGRIFLSSESILDTIFGSTWSFAEGIYGLKPYIAGSLLVTGIALLIGAIPSIFCAIYLSEYAPERLRRIIKPFVDLLASIPSVIYGLWGLIYVVPLVRNDIAPLFGAQSPGQSLMSGGFVLGIMISPIIVSITDEVLQSVPDAYTKASLALGSTKWQSIKNNIKKVALPGIVGGIILGFGRAIGETIAMSMISGSTGTTPGSVFDPFATLTTLINNKLGYSAHDPKSVAALSVAGLILLIIVLITNLFGRFIVSRATRGEGKW